MFTVLGSVSANENVQIKMLQLFSPRGSYFRLQVLLYTMAGQGVNNIQLFYISASALHAR